MIFAKEVPPNEFFEFIEYFRSKTLKTLVFKSFDQLKNSLIILNDVLKNFSVNKKRMFELANEGYITATDLADYMVKELNYPFRKAYLQTTKIITVSYTHLTLPTICSV